MWARLEKNQWDLSANLHMPTVLFSYISKYPQSGQVNQTILHMKETSFPVRHEKGLTKAENKGQFLLRSHVTAEQVNLGLVEERNRVQGTFQGVPKSSQYSKFLWRLDSKKQLCFPQKDKKL